MTARPDFRLLALREALGALDTLWEDSRDEVHNAVDAWKEDEGSDEEVEVSETDLQVFRVSVEEAIAAVEKLLPEDLDKVDEVVVE